MITIRVGDNIYKPEEDYTLELSYTRSGGWNLWRHPITLDGPLHADPELIAGAMSENNCTIEINGNFINT